MASVMGWDLGGANLKLARIEGGRAEHVAQIPCPLRQAVSKFDAALEEALPLCPPHAAHAVTMTGELSDVFADRAEGVAYLVDMMRNATGGEALFYAAPVGLSRLHPRGGTLVGSGIGQLACERRADRSSCSPTPCLIDAGTTTTDLVPLKAGRDSGARLLRRRAAGRKRARLYRGRAHAGDGGGAECAVQGPHAADRRRALRHHGRCLAAGGRAARRRRPLPYPRSRRKKHRGERRAACAHARTRCERGRPARLRRSRPAISPTARSPRSRRRRARCSPAKRIAPDAPLVGAGCGRFIARDLAARLGRPYYDFAELIDCAPDMRDMAAPCAPAVAVGLLAEREFVIAI